MSDYDDDWPRNVTAKESRERAQRSLKKLQADGHELTPVASKAQGIAVTFWGRSWCRNLERYSDYESRLPRGRSYLKNGCVLDLRILPARVEARVQGNLLYDVVVRIEPLDDERWALLRDRSKGEVSSLLDLLAGRLGDHVMQLVTAPDEGLFPAPGEIRFSCTCPDDADMCKHTAAVLYGIGVRLDERPELLFELRRVNHRDLVAGAGAGLDAAAGDTSLEGNLGDLFGIDLDGE